MAAKETAKSTISFIEVIILRYVVLKDIKIERQIDRYPTFEANITIMYLAAFQYGFVVRERNG